MMNTNDIKKLTEGLSIGAAAEKIYNECRDEDDHALRVSAYRLKAAADKLFLCADRVKERGERTAREVEKMQTWREDMSFGPFYSGINSLGELQGSAIEFDIACAMYDREFREFNGILSSRARDEHKAVKQAEFADLLDGEKQIVAILRKQGDTTMKQLARDLRFDEAAVCLILKSLIEGQWVKQIGKHYRFDATRLQ